MIERLSSLPIHSRRRSAVEGDDPPPAPGAAERHFLPPDYVENPVLSVDDDEGGFWDEEPSWEDLSYQRPVYRWAARLVARDRLAPVVDVGCGTGHKLVEHLLPITSQVVGVDQASGIGRARTDHPDVRFITGELTDEDLWAQLRSLRPGFVLCADVVEHVEDPSALVAHLAALVGDGPGRLLISTPDRSRLERAPRLGPPTNPLHVREWEPPELRHLLEASGLTVIGQRHLLPRHYRVTTDEVMRLQRRLRQRRPVPDPRSCMAFLTVARRAPSA